MTTSPNLQIEHIAASQAQKEVTCNTAFDTLDRSLCEVLSKAMADANQTLTDAEANNAIYIKLTGALTVGRTLTLPARKKLFVIENATTGAFAVTVKSGAGATVALPMGERRFLYNNAVDVMGITAGGSTAPYDIGGALGGLPTASQTILRYPLPRAVRFSAGLPSSQGLCGTAPTAAVTYSLKKNGVQFATMQFAASATTATFTAATDTDLAAGDVLTLTAPATPDSTQADLAFSFAALRL